MRHVVACRYAFLTLALTVAAPTVAAAQTCEAPKVLIVLDRSSSMVTGTTPSGLTKWAVATNALQGLVNRFGDRIDFGLMVFPDPNQCSPGSVFVDIGDPAINDIATVLADPPPDSGNYTPMSETLVEASSYAPLQVADEAYVLLITDGWQWCDPYDSSTRFGAVDAVSALAALSIDTFVLGFGGSVDALNNNRMAVAGGTAIQGCDPTGDSPTAADLCYFQADSSAELDAAFDEIALTIDSEACDGLDNDCDGFIDNQWPGDPTPLSQTCAGGCGTGDSVCTDGSWTDCAVAESCDDRNLCTTGDWCDGESCTGTAVSCDDGIACTVDSCDPGTGCAFQPNHYDCDDGNPCTDDVCDTTQGCAHVPNEAPCSDGDPCTENDVCSAGSCSGAVQPDCYAPSTTTDEELGGTEAVPGTEGGCNCRDSGGSAWPVAFVGLLLLRRRRR